MTSERPDQLTPLSEAEERLLRGLLASSNNAWDVSTRLWLARLLASLDAERAEVDRLEERLMPTDWMAAIEAARKGPRG